MYMGDVFGLCNSKKSGLMEWIIFCEVFLQYSGWYCLGNYMYFVKLFSGVRQTAIWVSATPKRPRT